MVQLIYSDISIDRLRKIFLRVWYSLEAFDDEGSWDEPTPLSQILRTKEETDIGDLLIEIIRDIRKGTNNETDPIISTTRIYELMSEQDVIQQVEYKIGKMIR